MNSIKAAIDDIKQQQQKKSGQNSKKDKAKNKRNQRSLSPSSKKGKRRYSVLLRGGKTVKKVILEKVSSHKAPGFAILEGNGNDSQKNLEIEFVSTPFNDEIAPIKITKLEKFASIAISKDQPAPQMKAPFMMNEMPRYLPSSYAPLQKNIMPFPQETPVLYREKVNPKQMILMGLPNDKLNMGINGMNGMNGMNPFNNMAAMNGMNNMNFYQNSMMLNGLNPQNLQNYM